MGANKLLCLVLAGILISACGEDTVEPTDIGDPGAGRQVFDEGGYQMAGTCADCHSLGEDELTNFFDEPIAPSMLGVAERAGSRVEGLSAIEYLRQSIEDPEAYRVEGYDDFSMNPFLGDLLTEKEMDDLIAFLLTQ